MYLLEIKHQNYRIKLKKNIYLTELDGEYILLSISPFAYFHLNKTMYIYYLAIKECKYYVETLTRLQFVFSDIELAQICDDLNDVIHYLRYNKLLY